MATESELRLWARSFVDWSQGPMGFIPDRYWSGREWVTNSKNKPVRWQPFEQTWMRHCLTLNEKGRLPYHTIIRLDPGKSGKSTWLAAVSEWFGEYIDPPGAEILLVANAEKQARIRAYRWLRYSIEHKPTRMATTFKDHIEFDSGNLASPVPVAAGSQAGSDNSLIAHDEFWDWTTELAQRAFEEMKLSPTRNVSLRIIATYPGFAGDTGPLADYIDRFFDSNEEPRPDVSQVAGLEDLPCWTKDGVFFWWNHDPLWPWHTPEFMAEQRKEAGSRVNAYYRIWEARVVQPLDSFIDEREWDACTDEDLAELSLTTGRKETVVIGVDIGLKHDTSAAVARAYNPATGTYDLRKHRIWRPGDEVGSRGKIVEHVVEWILRIAEKHKVLAVYYDPSQFALGASILERRMLGCKLIEVTQNLMREEADTAYKELIYSHNLRNYGQSFDLRDAVLSAVARYTAGQNIRLDKRKSSKIIDAAVADSMCCYGVTQHQRHFEALARAHAGFKPAVFRGNPFLDAVRLGEK